MKPQWRLQKLQLCIDDQTSTAQNLGLPADTNQLQENVDPRDSAQYIDAHTLLSAKPINARMRARQLQRQKPKTHREVPYLTNNTYTCTTPTPPNTTAKEPKATQVPAHMKSQTQLHRQICITSTPITNQHKYHTHLQTCGKTQSHSKINSRLSDPPQLCTQPSQTHKASPQSTRLRTVHVRPSMARTASIHRPSPGMEHTGAFFSLVLIDSFQW